MTLIMTVAGSPAAPSRSAAVLEYIRLYLELRSFTVEALAVRDLDATDLLHGRYESPALRPWLERLAAARGVMFATPVYKAAYTGILKAFLDVLPANALAGKVVLPIVTGGSAAHSLVVDYALKPVLAALGATHIPGGIYLMDAQYEPTADHSIHFLDAKAEQLVQNTVEEFVNTIRQFMKN